MIVGGFEYLRDYKATIPFILSIFPSLATLSASEFCNKGPNRVFIRHTRGGLGMDRERDRGKSSENAFP